MCRDQLHQTLQRHVFQEEYADQLFTKELTQLRMVVAEQEDAMARLETDSTNALPCQHEEHAHKQQFHEFNSAIKHKDEAVHALQ